MKKGISFSGKICSGKTHLANIFCDRYKWDKMSFRIYLTHLLNQEGKKDSRENLQNLGKKITDKGSFSDFLLKTIQYNNPKGKVHVFDSIRHIEIIEEARKLYDVFITIYIEADDKIRYERYLKKHGQIDYDKFIKISDHPIEINIHRLKQIADFTITNETKTEDVVLIIEEQLRRTGYI